MPTIQVLPKRIAELIAAGEVIDRPAAVVKELCENALDAGATAVTVEIRSGGVKYIRVQDNGCGIPAAELPTAFLPHATSKIQTAEDIDAIGTLGFRGEALPSIAAVARVEALSRTAGAEIGARYAVEGGQTGTLEEAGCPQGTTVTVRDLFFQTPARMKFLKKDVTEGGAVAAVLERLALSRPDAAITFLREGKEVFRSPGGNQPGGVIRAVLGKAFFEQCAAVRGDYGLCTAQGFVTLPAFARPTRNQQYFFLNGRSIRCPAASAALADACKRSVPAGRHPGCVLYLTMPLGVADINVHPAKMEVRFADERPVFLAVRQAAMQLLPGAEMPSPEASVPHVRTAPPPVVFQAQAYKLAPSPLPTPVSLRDGAASDGNPFAERDTPPLLQTAPAQSFTPAPPAETPVPAEQLRQPEALRSCRVLGEAFETYILAERGEELLLIDKHAAHERIIYERLRTEYLQNGGAQRQLLLTPLPLQLSREESAVLLENADVLASAGFALEAFGGGTLLLRECPLLLAGKCDPEAQIREIAGILLEKRGDIDTDALDWIFHSAACRAAVKAGDHTNTAERERFVETLLALPGIAHCPHGRPVMAVFHRRELEKRFGRA
ncbi:MAG: DNA mismatch repair endonuclease MutL [Oscillospiraceae bacterium]|jgi:DNA mismatch repair protein MutL|nr:DNA mismatch repair endonuclease MutL [Oscillospiraceae bacterium]